MCDLFLYNSYEFLIVLNEVDAFSYLPDNNKIDHHDVPSSLFAY